MWVKIPHFLYSDFTRFCCKSFLYTMNISFKRESIDFLKDEILTEKVIPVKVKHVKFTLRHTAMQQRLENIT